MYVRIVLAHGELYSLLDSPIKTGTTNTWPNHRPTQSLVARRNLRKLVVQISPSSAEDVVSSRSALATLGEECIGVDFHLVGNRNRGASSMEIEANFVYVVVTVVRSVL